MKSSPGIFITGTDTDAGKTIAAAALLRAMPVARAIKPVQTGCPREGTMLIAPDVQLYNDASPGAGNIALHCFEPAVSPHLAAKMAGTDLHAASLAAEIRAAMRGGTFTVVEGAGGVLAPLNENESMLDLMLELGLPVLLAVPNRLGAISHAMLALRVLAGAGLAGAGIVLCRISPDTDSLLDENREWLERHGPRSGYPLICELPWNADVLAPERGLRHAAFGALGALLVPFADSLAAAADAEKNRAAKAKRQLPQQEYPKDRTAETCGALCRADARTLWHPYAGTNPAPAVRPVAGAHGCRIRLADGQELVDGMSSWWCASLGYSRRDLYAALKNQARELPHVMFGGFTHAPAISLAQKLLEICPPGLARVFFADSGSVAVEVAMKMALQYQLARGNVKKTRFCALRGAYHGDTLGAMSVCDPENGMHHIFAGYLPQQYFLERPECRFDGDGSPHAFPEDFLRRHAAEIAAVIVEPIVQGAGGMWFYHPSWLARLAKLCSELDILLIADEIATGFGRTGKLFACEWAGVSPDILCLGKALTGGMVSFAAVLAREKIADAISCPANSSQPGILLHGPTFMANPLACSVALQAVESLLAFPWPENVARIEKELAKGLAPCTEIRGVRDVRVLGAIGVVETEKPVNTEKLQEFFVSCGVWIRPFSRLIYLMPPFPANDAEIGALTAAVCRACEMGLHLA